MAIRRLTLATGDAAQPLCESPARLRENGWQKDRLSSVLLLCAFARGFQRENFCSWVSVCLANERVQLRRRASAIDTFARKGSSFGKMVRERRHVKSCGGIYDHQIARGSRFFGLFTFQNCADQFCVCARVTAAKSIEALPFQSKILRRNREGFHAAVRQTGSDESSVGDCYFIEAVGPVHYPCFLHA